MQAAYELIAHSHLTDATLDDELRMFDAIDWSSLPVYVHKSSTARRLRNLIARLFPDRDHRYIK